MVTRWQNHWDKIYTTSFARSMIKVNLADIENGAETIFIKINADDGKMEKAWNGYIDQIEKKVSKINFRVNLNGQLPLSKVKSYSRLRDGWYLYKSNTTHK